MGKQFDQRSACSARDSGWPIGLPLQWVVVVVSSGVLVGVDPWWGDEFRSVVGSDPDLPFRRMGLLMVVQAEEDTVGQGGGSTVEPADDVVGLGHAGGPVAAGPRAATVAEHECVPQMGWVEPLTATDIQDGGGAVEDGGQDAGIAQDPAGHADADRSAVAQGRVTELPGDGVEVDGHRDVRDMPADGRSGTSVQIGAEHLDVCLGEPMSGGPWVLHPVLVE